LAQRAVSLLHQGEGRASKDLDSNLYVAQHGLNGWLGTVLCM